MPFNCSDQTSASWVDRARICVDLIKSVHKDAVEPMSVADIGCGDMKLKSIMDEQTVLIDYAGFDLLPQSPMVTKFDVRREALPNTFSIVTMMGVIEDLDELEKVFVSLHDKCDYLIVSHVAADITDYSTDDLARMGWSTYLSSQQLEKMLVSCGFRICERKLTAERKTFLWLLQS